MCDQKSASAFHVLAANDLGYVGLCENGTEVQFRVGSVFSFMPPKAFLNLHRSIERVDPETATKGPDGRIMLRTPVDNFLMALCCCEFEEMQRLFGTAADKLQLLSVLSERAVMN